MPPAIRRGTPHSSHGRRDEGLPSSLPVRGVLPTRTGGHLLARGSLLTCGCVLTPGSLLVQGLRKARSATLRAVLLVLALACIPGAAVAAEGQTASAAAASATPPITAVRVTTSMGAFVIELNAERAPLTVQNFLRYVNEGFYTNTLFHRVVGGFVVQGGGYDASTMKTKATHDYVFNESGNGLQNTRGTVGMARSGPPHSANSQFYVNLVDNSELDPLPTRWGYAVFGEITEGMDVIERMGVVATGSVGPFKSEAPLKPIVIEKVEPLTNAAAPSTAAPSATGAPPDSAGAAASDTSGEGASNGTGQDANNAAGDGASSGSGQGANNSPSDGASSGSGESGSPEASGGSGQGATPPPQ